VPEGKRESIRERMARRLDWLRERSEFRTLAIPAGINLSSNDYLGLAGNPRLKQAVREALARATTVGSTGSRLLSGNSVEWEHAERAFADFAGTEAALYFVSGYAANIGLLASIAKPGDVIFSDALNHASLIDGVRLSGAAKVIYPHGDLRFLENALREHQHAAGARLIVSESVFSMEGDTAPLDGLLRLARKLGAEIVLDEAHATGVCGPRGRGVAAKHGCEREILAVVHTCGKALASSGAFVCGDRGLRDYLVNHARTFIFSTAMPPYIAGQIQAAVALARDAESERSHLARMAELLRKELRARGFDCGASTTHIVPVMVGANEMAAHIAGELRRAGFFVKAIRPPTVPPGTARVRLSLTSRIASEDIYRLANEMESARLSAQRVPSVSTIHA
jgi:8-amino-7-oxononanoate synthase